LDYLGARGVLNLLIEGGGSVHGAFFDARLVDKVYAFVAPLIVGGETSLSPVEGSGVSLMGDAWYLAETRTEQIGPDWLIIGYPRKESQELPYADLDGDPEYELKDPEIE
jgi:diaminohydroxyphosphoribosylaminopyrimidine deaminase/5-amino-6-(5-phosphoribosylamino)uracil reductase